jgi:hypothetical protein
MSVYLTTTFAVLKAIEEHDLTPERFRKIAPADNALIAATFFDLTLLFCRRLAFGRLH